MRIGVYCGSFNPIHKGHTALADYILRHTELDEVWLMVSPNNPLKQAGDLLDEQVRLHMAELATAALPGIRCSDFECHLPKPTYTIQTFRALEEAYPEHQFALIIGSDNMALFHRWREHETLLANYPIYVYPRKGDDMEALQQTYPVMHVVEGAPILPISATELREEIAQGHYNEKWLDNAVADFLKKNTNLFADMKKM